MGSIQKHRLRLIRFLQRTPKNALSRCETRQAKMLFHACINLIPFRPAIYRSFNVISKAKLVVFQSQEIFKGEISRQILCFSQLYFTYIVKFWLSIKFFYRISSLSLPSKKGKMEEKRREKRLTFCMFLKISILHTKISKCMSKVFLRKTTTESGY